ncbi:MAG: amidohydrolase family protein [Actinomycetota bacterium]|nr:amidohydrolase family protein [Actinomycetota bacterium]
MLDVVIRNGSVLDGTGGDAQRLDVAVKDGVIVALAPAIDGDAAEVIDAAGRIVTPGFVDVHSHYDAQVIWDSLLEPSSPHGVTTVVLGNCGVGFAPVRPSDRDTLIRLIEGVEDVPGDALAAGMAWNWETFPEYLDHLAGLQWSMDVGTQLAHGPLRTYAMGADAVENRPADAGQMALMERVAREAAEAGSFGFSTSRTLGHRSLDGTPVPGTYASFDELLAIGRGTAAGGGGILEFAAAGLARSDSPEVVAAEFQWIGALAEATGLPATFIELQAHDAPGRWLGEMEQAAIWRGRGVSVTPLIAGRSGGVLWGWDVRHPFLTRPSYQAVAHLPLAERLQQLRRPAVRAAILAEDDNPLTPYERKQRSFMRNALPASYLLSGVPDYEQPRERSLGALAEAHGRTIDEVVYDGMLAADDVMVLYPMYNYVDADHEVLYQQLADADALVGTNDGGAHCAYTCDASIPTFLLTHWARDRQRGPRLELAEIVRRLTSQPAALYRMADRGRVAVGLRADLNVIDIDHLRLGVPRAVHDLPGGATRLLQDAAGYDITMVAGQVTRRAGTDTGARPGRLLRRT